MVFIHGGAFIAGTSASYDSTLLARYGQAVVVTLNYRINAIGGLNVVSQVGYNSCFKLNFESFKEKGNE